MKLGIIDSSFSNKRLSETPFSRSDLIHVLSPYEYSGTPVVYDFQSLACLFPDGSAEIRALSRI